MATRGDARELCARPPRPSAGISFRAFPARSRWVRPGPPLVWNGLPFATMLPGRAAEPAWVPQLRAAAHEDLDDRGQEQRKVWFLREGLFAKYVMSLVGLVVFVLAVNGADRNLDQLPRDQDHADRRHDGEGRGHLQAHRPIDERAGAAGQPRHIRLCPHRRATPRHLRPAARPGARSGAAVATRRPGQGAAAAVAPRSRSRPASIWRAIRASPKRSRAASATRRPISPARGR